MSDNPETGKPKPERPGGKSGIDRIDLLFVLLFLLFMGLVLLAQYQGPLVVDALDSIFGSPRQPVEMPVPPVTVPTMPSAPAPKQTPVPLKLPRETHGIKFLTSYAHAKAYIMQKYKPAPKNSAGKGQYWRLLDDGTLVAGGRREIRLEYMGDETQQTPRYLSFDFYRYEFTGVREKYFRVDPLAKLNGLKGSFGDFTSEGIWQQKYDRYIWDNGQLRAVFLVDRTSRVSIFSFQMKEFER